MLWQYNICTNVNIEKAMRFEWDADKNIINIKKHGIDFKDVTEMFNYEMLSSLDLRGDYGEERWVGLGWLKPSLGVVVYVERHEDTIRIISARKATKYEVKKYENHIKN
jgi:uncharacterized DUF497 family protein